MAVYKERERERERENREREREREKVVFCNMYVIYHDATSDDEI